MDPIENPFSPGAGSPPPELVGRGGILQDATVLLGRTRRRRSEKCLLLTGLRGVGKTVLLNEIKRIAQRDDYRVVSIEAFEDKTLSELMVPHLRTLLYDLDRMAGVGNKVKVGLAVLRSFLGTIKVSSHDVTFGLDIAPAKGTADSGELEIDLPALFVAIAEAALDRETSVAIFIDEIQYLNSKELGALISAMHRIQQMQLPLVLIGAGLPVLPALAGEAKSYAERLFSFPRIGALSDDDTNKAINDPANAHGVVFEDAAVQEIYRLTKGYPYFLQEWAYQAWNLSTTKTITLATVQNATTEVLTKLDQSFFRVRFDRLTSGERSFLRAMADCGSENCRTGDLAEALRVKLTSLSPVRANLIRKGMIYSPSHGDLAFTVPLFDEFMKRAIADIKPSK